MSIPLSIAAECWRGYFAAVPTPFTADGDLDPGRFGEVIGWLLAQRPHGLVVNGTTGEWYAQSAAERRAVLARARALVPADLPLLVGISSIEPAESIELGRHAAASGADGVLLTIPPARLLTPAEIVRFYAGAAESIELPLLVYNVPGSVGQDLPTELVSRLMTINGVVGVKDNTPSAQARAATLRALGGAAVFSDVLEPGTFPLFADEGCGRGQIGSGMPLGHPLAAAFEAVRHGDRAAAEVVVEAFTEFKAEVVRIVGTTQPWHAQIKAIMYAGGVDAGYPRFPAISIREDAERIEQLRRLITAATTRAETAVTARPAPSVLETR